MSLKKVYYLTAKIPVFCFYDITSPLITDLGYHYKQFGRLAQDTTVHCQ